MKKLKKTGKRRKSTKKPVENYVQLKAVSNSEGVVRFEFSENGKVTCHEAIVGSIKSYSSYQRELGKNKYITQSTGIGKSAHLHQKYNIQANYTIIAGMDTNDYKYGERNISISSSFISETSIQENSFSCGLLPAFIIFNVREGLNPETVGWHLFFKHIVPMLELSSERKLGLVVDSELGRHLAINSRVDPYYKSYLLPENIDFIYASSDTGTDAPNQLIKACDKASRELFNQIENGILTLPEQIGGETDDFLGYVFVNFDNVPYKIQV